MEMDDIAASIIKRHANAAQNRGTFEAHWEECAKRVLPQYSGSFHDRDGLTTQGEKKTDEMFDATAALALTRFAAAMESMLTPRNSKWHRIVSIDKTLKKNRAVQMWMDDVTNLLFKYRYAPQANYASQQHESYMALGAFGTGGLFVDALDPAYGKGIRYQHPHLGEVYFLDNHQGIIDTSLRKFELTARQAMQRWPEGLPEDIVNAAKDDNKGDAKFWFIHCVKPRSEAEGYDPQRIDVNGMKFASYYVSVTGKKTVQKGGYHSFPYAISRYVVAPGELYGRSPAMLALPAIKVLNEEKKTVLKQGHRVVDPVLLAHDDGVLDAFSLKPGAVNYGGVNAEGRPLVHTLPTGNIAVAQEMMDAEKAVINDAFLVTLFQILVETPRMTATEVLERAREKGALLSPTMGRQQSEALGPMIDRELDVLGSQGLLPPMPQMLKEAKGEYEIAYDSPLSRSQKAEEAAGLTRLIDWTREYVAVTADPTPLDWIDWDTIMPELADIQAVPARWVRDPAVVAQRRAERAEAAQAQQMIDAAPAAASVMKSMQGANAR